MDGSYHWVTVDVEPLSSGTVGSSSAARSYEEVMVVQDVRVCVAKADDVPRLKMTELVESFLSDSAGSLALLPMRPILMKVSPLANKVHSAYSSKNSMRCAIFWSILLP